MINEINFQNVHIAAGGAIRDALTAHRVLTAALDMKLFVIAHVDDIDRARETADALNAEHEGLRKVLLILLIDEHFDALADGVQLNLPVFHTRNVYRRASTAIKVTNAAAVTLPTEHGDFLSEVTTTRDLRAGDVYTCGVRRLPLTPDDNPGLAVYRARADYDPTTGEVRHHLVDCGYTPKPGERTGALTAAPDQLVHRIVDRAAFLAQLDLTDLATTNA